MSSRNCCSREDMPPRLEYRSVGRAEGWRSAAEDE